MTLKMNMHPVKLATTGRHLFDVPYCYRHKFNIDGITVEYGNHGFYASAEMSPEQQARLVEEINAANSAQEREWNINQPVKY